MANKPNPIIFKITDAGRLAVLDAQKQGISLSLKTLVAGTSKYVPTGKETRIRTEAMRSDIVTSGIEKDSKSLRFSVSLNSIQSRVIHEIGLLTSDNTLFAVAASNTPLFTVYANVTFVGSFGLSLGEIDVENITVSTDPDAAIVVKMMEDHVGAANPHPQYINNDKFSQLDKKVDKLGQNINTASGDLSKHIAAANPHPQYTLKTVHDAHVKLHDALKKLVDTHAGTLTQHGGQLTQHSKDITKVSTDLSNHTKAADPHTQYAKKTDLSGHTSAAHPHSQYLRESDLAGMKKQIEQLQQQLVAAQSKVTELPIGSIYTTTNNYKSSAEVKAALGYGTWARFAEGKTLVGISTKAADPAWTKTLKSSFGAYEHKLVAEEMPSTALKVREAGYHGARRHGGGGTGYASGAQGKMIPLPTSETGWKDKPHNNVQPSIVVAYWLRTA
uniref:Baseplate structural protein Gp10 C-terminal domain-containing protein n=1 Tax=Psychrobacter sp. (strain PRwf-1) TaxID=349106 RepID=A5WF12_PSYWF